MCNVGEVLRTTSRQLVRTQLRQADHGDVACEGRDHSTTFPDRSEPHTRDAGEHVDPDRLDPERQDLIRLRQATPRLRRRNESEFTQGATEPARVCFAGIDEQVEILRIPFVSVHADREPPDHHEPDPMVHQQM